MNKMRAYYSAPIKEFLSHSLSEILGDICSNSSSASTTIQQQNAWEAEIKILKEQLRNFCDGRVLFEYVIPRMGKRIDVVVLYKNIVFLLEFKCGDVDYKASAYDQVYDYALDLRNFQKESHNKLLVPMVVATKAGSVPFNVCEIDRIIEPIKCNEGNISSAISLIVGKYKESYFDYAEWENSEYYPTPTIVEAAQALYQGHHVEDITRNDAGVENLSVTADAINKIIEYSKLNNRKSICFVTGVPGAGKTLAGLNIAIQRSNARMGEHAVFLSGNYPLVTVLQEALARDKIEQEKNKGNRLTKTDSLRATSAFIQIIHKYRDSFVGNDNMPPEHVVIFDEAQRAWTHEMIRKFMSTKKGIDNFLYSEPEFLISAMDRHKDWAVIVCLIGGGQEINTSEAGLPEWFDSLRRSFLNWEVYIAPQLDDEEYRFGRSWGDLIAKLNVKICNGLHLANSVRSFRTPEVPKFVKSILDCDITLARSLYVRIFQKFPIFVTRDLKKAKEWIRMKSRGTVRFGLLASSGALRLKPEGIFVKNEISIADWFLNGKEDVRSSYALEDVVTEFDIQGLEVDYTVVAWDADFYFDNNTWVYRKFSGSSWHDVRKNENRMYIKNAYRVLLTRARQGMVVFVPYGTDADQTRLSKYYDNTFNYLRQIGIKELP